MRDATPDNGRPALTEDLTHCAVCGQPATGWADDRERNTYGACGSEHRAVIALWPTPSVESL